MTKILLALIITIVPLTARANPLDQYLSTMVNVIDGKFLGGNAAFVALHDQDEWKKTSMSICQEFPSLNYVDSTDVGQYVKYNNDVVSAAQQTGHHYPCK